MKSAEISYDVVMDDDVEFVEGTYRLPRTEWSVFVTLRRDISGPVVKPVTWGSGVAGVNLICPQSLILNEDTVQSLLGDALGVDEWEVVRGPDSMTLR